LLFFFIIFIVAEPQSSASCLELSAVADGDLLAGLSRLAAEALSGLDDVVAINDLSEDDVLSVEPSGLGGADEELGSVGVGTSVGHGQNTLTSVGKLEVLVGELGTIDGFTTTSITTGEIYTKEIKEVNYRARDLVIVFPYAKPYVLPPP